MSDKKVGEEPYIDGDVLRMPIFIEDITRFVQLIPTLPTISGSSKYKVVIQVSRYGGFWVRLRHPISVSDFKGYLDECEDKKSGAVYAAIPEDIVEKDLIAVLKQRKYKFYTHHRDTDELVWFKWTREGIENRVPKYATSIEGGGAVVLSPDEKKVLLVHEFGRWGRSGGALEYGESCLETAIREVKEETGVKLDSNFVPLLGLGYQMPSSRDGIINDHFLYFILKAVSLDVNIQEDEISKAGWFDVEKCVKGWQEARKDFISKNPGKPLPSRVDLDGECFGSMELMALERFLTKTARPVTFMKGKRAKPAIVF